MKLLKFQVNPADPADAESSACEAKAVFRIDAGEIDGFQEKYYFKFKGSFDDMDKALDWMSFLQEALSIRDFKMGWSKDHPIDG